MKNYRRYEQGEYSVSEIIEKLSNIVELPREYYDDIENVLYQLKHTAQNEYNCDYWRVLWSYIQEFADFANWYNPEDYCGEGKE